MRWGSSEHSRLRLQVAYAWMSGSAKVVATILVEVRVFPLRSFFDGIGPPLKRLISTSEMLSSAFQIMSFSHVHRCTGEIIAPM